MEWVIFALLFWFFFSRSKKRRAKKDFERAKKSLAKQQRRYENFMNSLPELVGDGSFSQEVRGEQAYKKTIDMYGKYLQDHHPGEDEFYVMVELEPKNKYDKNAVRVDAGQANIGHIPREEAADFRAELKVHGGRAKCTAKLYWSPEDGLSSVRLDIVRPL